MGAGAGTTTLSFVNVTESDGYAMVCTGSNVSLLDFSLVIEGALTKVGVAAISLASPASPTWHAFSNNTGSPPRCAALIQRAAPQFNTTDLVAEHQQFECDAGMATGGTDVVGCELVTTASCDELKRAVTGNKLN